MRNRKLNAWGEEIRELWQPDAVAWCDGSEEEYLRLLDGMVRKGAAVRLNQQLRPGCYLFRSHPSDVARVEDRTFVATRDREEAGPNNNWRDPDELKEEMRALYRGCMRGRTMYVVPFVMGPLHSPFSIVGVEITDSPYVVVNMRLMTRMGEQALDMLGEGDFIPCLHSVGAPLQPGQEDVAWPCAPELSQKYIAHFPEDMSIWSYGSGYGGNALLGKKCLALRIASAKARNEGWMAEHMLIMGITDPVGRKSYFTAAFPSACGKTNLAMLVPTLPGWKVETLGDDIAWLRRGEDGRLRAVNPEAGFFGVAPGTSFQTNPNAMHSISQDTLFTNVALTDEGDVWWEGIGTPPPPHLTDWQGKDWAPGAATPAAHPNARFTVSITRCPSLAPEWEAPEGVPVSAILIGGRRPGTVPLVYESRSWRHGVFMGSIMGSEITAAAISNAIGQVRRDPFAMLPFIGYNIKDYLRHWLDMESRFPAGRLPKVYSVNWFRKDAQGRFLWPGFGDNARVLKWIFERVRVEGGAKDTPVGAVPAPGDLDLGGLDVSQAAMETLLSVDGDEWRKEAASIRSYYQSLGDGLPKELWAELEALEARLSQAE